MSLPNLSLDFESLRSAYEGGSCSPHHVIDEVFARIERDRQRVRNVWLHLLAARDVHSAVTRAIARRSAGESMPLFGIPFAVKDNIDVAGIPTTAACPAFAYIPRKTASVVEALQNAGAILIG